jgi:hypothetical protein
LEVVVDLVAVVGQQFLELQVQEIHQVQVHHKATTVLTAMAVRHFKEEAAAALEK